MKKWIPMFPGSSAVLAFTLVLVFGAGTASAQKRVYVAEGTFPYAVYVIDAGTNTVMASIPMPTGASTDGLAATPDGAFVYAANALVDEVAIINVAANAVSATVKVGTEPHDV